jgi:hypothetical protein
MRPTVPGEQRPISVIEEEVPLQLYHHGSPRTGQTRQPTHQFAAIAAVALLLPIMFVAAASGVMASVFSGGGTFTSTDTNCVPAGPSTASGAGYPPEPSTFGEPVQISDYRSYCAI